MKFKSTVRTDKSVVNQAGKWCDKKCRIRLEFFKKEKREGYYEIT